MALSDRKGQFFRNEVKEITFFAFFGILMTIVVPLFFGFGLLGFEESFVSGRPLQFGDFLTTYIVYYAIIFGGLIGLVVFKVREMAITNKDEHPSTQKNPHHLAVGIIHDPEQDGALYNLFDWLGFKKESNPMRWSLSIFRTFMVAILIFGTLGVLQTLYQFSFVDVPQITLGQQITPANQILFSTEPPAFAETTLMLFVLCLFLSELAWFNSKLRWGKAPYFILATFIVSPLIATGWSGFHRIVYGNVETALFVTFLFGFIGSLITILTGSIWFWYVWHFMNNFFISLSKYATSNEDIVFLSIVGLTLLAIIWISGEVIIRRYRKKKEYVPLVPQ